MPDQEQKDTSSETREIKDLPNYDNDFGVTDAENVKGGRMREDPEVTKIATRDT
jgi:hypothetical protein